eukprot:9562551-Lingulodinium_polyedra.AAC.1
MSDRSPRPLTVSFAARELTEQWSSLAAMKSPGFFWDGSGYAAKSRSQAADRVGLERHAAALEPLLRMAPTGFPAIGSVRAALMELHKAWTVFPDVLDKHLWKASAEAADNWRIMCKHVYNLKRAGASDFKAFPRLKVLVDLIKLPVKTNITKKGTLDLDAVKKMFAHTDITDTSSDSRT